METAKRLFEHDASSLFTLARRLRMNRTTLQRWAKRGKWVRAERTKAVRTIYRRAAEQMLGRKLKPYEHVHHIDGDDKNNAESNLFVCRNAAAHSNVHASLEDCGFELLRAGVIVFDRRSKRYKIK